MVVTLNWNTTEETVECLDSLLRLRYERFDVTIVDNGSDDNSVDRIRQYILQHAGRKAGSGTLEYRGRTLMEETYQVPRSKESGRTVLFHLVCSPVNFGFTGGSNIGIGIAISRAYDFVLLLNNDTVVDAMCLDELVRLCLSVPRTGIVGSKVLHYDKPESIQTAGGRIHWATGRLVNFSCAVDQGQFDEVAERDVVYATSMLVQIGVFERVGLLDDTFFFGIEEYDLCARARRAGFRILYCPTSRVWHKGGRSEAKLVNHPETLLAIHQSRGFLGMRYEILFFRKHLGPYKAVIPLMFRMLFKMAAFVQIAARVAAESRRARYAEATDAVSSLNRWEVRKMFGRLYPRLRRK